MNFRCTYFIFWLFSGQPKCANFRC